MGRLFVRDVPTERARGEDEEEGVTWSLPWSKRMLFSVAERALFIRVERRKRRHRRGNYEIYFVHVISRHGNISTGVERS